MRRHGMGGVRSLAFLLVTWLAGTAGAAPAPVAPPASIDWNAFHYGRAIDCWSRGDLREAAGYLEHIDITPASPFAHADRAGFLLATTYLKLNDTREFERVAAVAGSESGSPYRRWIRYSALVVLQPLGSTAAAAPRDFAGGDILEAALLIENNQVAAAIELLDESEPTGPLASLHLYMRAGARRSAGGDPTADWEALAGRKPSHAHEADLVGCAAIELALSRIAQPDRARRALEQVPATSRYRAHALRLDAMLSMEAGDTARASSALRALEKDHSLAAGRRDTHSALGAMAMKQHHWYAALRYFETAEDDWTDESAAIERLARGDDLTAVWSAWRQPQNWNDEIRLSSDALFARVFEMADESTRKHAEPPAAADDRVAESFWPAEAPGASVAWDSTRVLTRATPSSEEWERVTSIERASVAARSELARVDARAAERREEIERRARYLDRGRASAFASTDSLAAATARLGALIARLDLALADLERVRDGALHHVASRTRDMISQLRDEVVFMRAIRHFHVDGPERARPEPLPPGIPAPSEVLASEEALALQAEGFLQFFAEHYSGVIRLSFERVWRPHLAQNSRRLRGELAVETARARGLTASIDSTRAALANDPALAAIERRRGALAVTIDSLDVCLVEAQHEIASAVASRAQARLALEREGVDYHLADATYELAVEAATDSITSEDPEAVVPLRDLAIDRLKLFLSRHPASEARPETRYRLADLHLMRARDEFRSRMAGFLGDAPSSDEIQNRALAPFVDYAPAIEQYEAILREDTAFVHTDAVLFNLGMILADDGRPDAMPYLGRLVAEYPASPDVQEAWLRMGNDRFDRRDFAEAAPLFERAVQGNDASFTAMALYKLGWSQFEEGRFDASIDAFAGLIDHYDRHEEIARKMDLRQEAEECLVHAMARAGGATAFARYFDRVGRRDYESRVLTSLAFLLRGSSLYGEAIECETLWLSRYPDDPAAFTVAERLVDTYQRWNKPELAREAKRAQAERFLPGSAWYRAQKDERVREAAGEFAQSGYREAAAFRHAQAKKSGDPAQWRDALAQYNAYLAHWPDGSDSPRMHFLAGDVASHLKDYPLALRHLSATMKSDSLPLVNDAAWQRVVITDAWYRSSQTAGAKTGSDSLATLVLKTGDEFTARFAGDPRSADVAWRQGNVALAHGRYDEAARRLERFGTDYSGDKRALSAVVRSADARYRLEKFGAAGATYERALVLARTAKRDSLATALETTIPTCYYQDAERIARADSARGERKAAPLFARVARSWPRFKHADLALYRAGLGFAADRQFSEATKAWEELLRVHPQSEYARDSAAQIAVTLDAAGKPAEAAIAYEHFARGYPKDPDAPQALLKAADLRSAAGDQAGAEKARTQFLTAFPGEVAAVMEIRAARAQKELASAASGGAPVSSLMGKTSTSDLKAYLALAEKHGELASPQIMAQCDFLQAEEAHTSYASIKLTQPLPKSIEKKKASLEGTIALYERSTKRGVAEYTRASAHRIGQSLIEFGEALEKSERPAGLGEEDLLAYNDVLTEQSYAFYDRGEDAWATLLRQSAREPDDPGGWLVRTREALWPRLGARFLFRPEVDYPLVRAAPPAAP